MKKLTVVLLAFASLISLDLGLVVAETKVGGIINLNTTWTTLGSPYIVVEDINVEEGATLTIQPGVTVRFDGHHYLMVSGTLVARGTPADSILFTSNRPEPSPGDWDGIRFTATSEDAVVNAEGDYVSGSVIEYARIEYGSGISCVGDYITRNASSPLISHNTIVWNSAGGSIATPKSSGGGIVCYYSGAVITHNTISGNRARRDGGGIFFDRFSRPVISYNTITGNSAGSDGGGIFCDYSPATITHNTIAENRAVRGGGIFVRSGSSSYIPKISHNTIHSNEGYDLYYLGELDIDVTDNWWGTSDTDSIGAQIYDYYDDFELGKVLTGPGDEREGELLASDLSSRTGKLASPSDRVLTIVRTNPPPRIDGRLERSVWSQAGWVGGFTQREPNEGSPATEETFVLALYDDDNIYFGFICLDSEPEGIIANEMRRDSQLDDNDSVEILLDTYNDRRGGFFFRVNPLGAKEDRLVADEGRTTNRDWDSVWKTKAIITDEGWTAEIAIPFNQLRFKESESMTWGVNFARNIRRKNEETYWVPVPRALGWGGRYRTSNLGKLAGLKGVKPSAHLELKPYFLPGSTVDYSDATSEEERVFDRGLDVKYGITSNLTADITYNTDFAQVEADVEQVNLTRFSLFFPEKRDFFLEGAGVFNFGARGSRGWGPPPFLLFYSRRIGLERGRDIPIILGTKMTGKVGPYTIGMLDVLTNEESYMDGDVPQIIPRTNFSVVRIKRDVLSRSSLGMMALNKQTGVDSLYSRGAGLDLNLSFLKDLNISGFVAKTWSPDKRGEDLAGSIGLDWGSDLFRFNLSYLEIGDNFDPEMGFVRRRNIRSLEVLPRYTPRPGIGWIRRLYIGPSLTYLTDRKGNLQTGGVGFRGWARLERGGWLGSEVTRQYERLEEDFEVREGVVIPADIYRFTTYEFSLFFEGGGTVSGRLSLNAGGYFNGSREGISINGRVKPNSQLTLDSSYGHNRVRLLDDSFSTNTLSSRISYSFSTDLFAKLFAQWNDTRELVSSNFLLNYIYKPGSDIYLVYNQSWDTSGGGLKTRDRTVLAKMTYLWSL